MKRRKSLGTQTIWISVGQFITFSFSILSGIILSRVFDLKEYGTYRQVMYAYNTMLVVFTLGLPRAYSYFLPKVSLEEAKKISNKITKLFFFLGLLFSLSIFFCSGVISNVLKNPELNTSLRIFSIVPIFMLPTMGVEGVLATYKKTELVALYNIITRFFMLISVALPVYLFNGGVNIAIIGFSFSSFVSFLLSMYLKNYPFKKVGHLIGVGTYKYKDIFKFSMPLLIANLWGMLLSSADQFFVSRYLGTESFAIYSNGAIELPFIPMIIGATATVLTPEFSRLIHEKNENRVFEIWDKVFSSTAIFIYPMIIFFLVYAEEVMILLYGDKYAVSGSVFRVFLIANFMTLAAYAPVVIAVGKTKVYSNGHKYAALLKCVLNVFLLYFISSIYTVAYISLICRLFLIFFMLSFIAKYFNKRIIQLFPVRRLLITILYCVISIILTYGIINVITIENLALKMTCSFLLFSFFCVILGRFVGVNYFEIIKSVIL